MPTENEGPDPPSSLPPDVAEGLAELNQAELRRAIDYAQQRRRHLQSGGDTEIEPGPGEELVRVEERPAYTLVVKRQPCAEGCQDCPHGPYLYHVREEPRPEGGQKLHWTYIGPVES